MRKLRNPRKPPEAWSDLSLPLEWVVILVYIQDHLHAVVLCIYGQIFVPLKQCITWKWSMADVGIHLAVRENLRGTSGKGHLSLSSLSTLPPQLPRKVHVWTPRIQNKFLSTLNFHPQNFAILKILCDGLQQLQIQGWFRWSSSICNYFVPKY